MEKIELKTNTREILGKKVRFLRREGITPVHIFGHDIDSLALQCDTIQLQQVLNQAGKTHIVNLMLDKVKKPRNVVVREIQRNVLTGDILHVDFYEVRMGEKIEVAVPIALTGEAPALRLKENMMEQELHQLNIECLPDRIPEHFEVDISSLEEADQTIYVKDISMGEGITVLADPEHIVVKISVRRAEKEEEVAAEEEIVVGEAEGEAEAAAPSQEESKEN